MRRQAEAALTISQVHLGVPELTCVDLPSRSVGEQSGVPFPAAAASKASSIFSITPMVGLPLNVSNGS